MKRSRCSSLIIWLNPRLKIRVFNFLTTKYQRNVLYPHFRSAPDLWGVGSYREYGRVSNTSHQASGNGNIYLRTRHQWIQGYTVWQVPGSRHCAVHINTLKTSRWTREVRGHPTDRAMTFLPPFITQRNKPSDSRWKSRNELIQDNRFWNQRPGFHVGPAIH